MLLSTVYGSQNYDLHTEHSDLDFKAIIIPTLEDLVNQTKPASKVYTYDWGQVEVKDIRNYIESAVKVNVNFIELLTTQYWVTDPDIAGKLNRAYVMRQFFEPLMQEQGMLYLRGCLGMIMQKYHAFSHPYPSKTEVLGKHGYDPKQLCHIVRLRMLMERYVSGNLSFLHEGDERQYLIDLKSGIIPIKSAEALAQTNIERAEKIVEEYKVQPRFDTKYKIINFSREVIIDTITNSIKEGLQK